MKFEIGDIVRIVNNFSRPMSFHKRNLVNKTGIVVASTDFKDGLLVQFFETGERVVFLSHHLIKEEDWVNRVPLRY